MSKSAKKKGMSMDEKCAAIDAWFNTHAHPYTMKELTAALPKATGVIWQSVEECVELLVSENRLSQEKVGVHTLFWRFPVTETQARLAASGAASGSGPPQGGASSPQALLQKRLSVFSREQLELERETQRTSLLSLTDELRERQAQVGSEQEVREHAVESQRLLQQRRGLSAQLQQLSLYSPHFVAQLQASTQVALDAANRWTDNYFMLEEHVTARMGRSARELRSSLRVPEDLDFIRGLTDTGGEESSASGLALVTEDARPPARATEILCGSDVVSCSIASREAECSEVPASASAVHLRDGESSAACLPVQMCEAPHSEQTAEASVLTARKGYKRASATSQSRKKRRSASTSHDDSADAPASKAARAQSPVSVASTDSQEKSGAAAASHDGAEACEAAAADPAVTASPTSAGSGRPGKKKPKGKLQNSASSAVSKTAAQKRKPVRKQ